MLERTLEVIITVGKASLFSYLILWWYAPMGCKIYWWYLQGAFGTSGGFLKPHMFKLPQKWLKLPKLRAICMKLCEIPWRHASTCVNFSAQVPGFNTQHVDIGPKIAKIAQIVWNFSIICVNLCEIAWGSAWNCVKVSPMNFSAWVHAFWYNMLKFAKKIAEIALIAWKLFENICEILWNLEYSMLLPMFVEWYLWLSKGTENGWVISMTDRQTNKDTERHKCFVL